MRTTFNERDIETFIEVKLRSLGWVDDIHNDKRNVWKQQPATEEQKRKLKGKRADYILYQSGTTNPLIVIETKRPSENIYQALEQGVNYAKSIEAPLVIATNGEFTKAYHIDFKKTLTRNGEEVKDFFAEKEALRFIEQPHLITQENKVVLSRRELIKIFAETNDLLRKKGLQAGDERFSEFANILFLKIIGEIEEAKENSTIEKRHLWSSWSSEKGDNLKIRMDKALEHFRQKYQEGELFSVSKIEDAKTLEKIVAKLNPLLLVETEREVKGEAFEYFLQRYNAGEKDLGEYFTPRHVIRNLVAILKPRFKEKIYDPFCGTGGMLIECFKYVSERIKLDPQNKEILTNCFYGNEITNVARITKMNMILFGDGHNNIQRCDTFQHPVNNEYDLIITNIPFGFSDIDFGNLYPISCKYGDCLAIQHCLMACKENGRIAMIMPEGFFTQKIKKYQDTKKWIIENYSIQVIISLPKGIFLPYTGSKSSVIIMEKKKRSRDYFYYYQIKNDGFTLNNHRDRTEGVNDWDILVSTWKEVVVEEKTTSPLFTKIYYKDIEENDYNLLPKNYNFPVSSNSEKKYFPLEEIAIVFHGCYDLQKKDFASNGFAKVYRQNHAISGDFTEGDYYIGEEKYQQLKKYGIQASDIIMSISGTLGKVALVPPEAEKGIAWNRLAVFRIKEEWKEKILPEYLLNVCQTPQMEKVLSDQSLGTTIQNVRMDSLKKFPIPIPSLEEQTKIISGLNKISQSIQNAQQIVDNLKLPLFVSLMKPIEYKKLGELATFEYGYNSKAGDKGKYRFIQTGDIDQYGNILEQERKCVDLPGNIDENKYLLNEKDIITARHGNCGRTAIFQSNEKTIFTNDLIRINLNKEIILPEYYWCFAQTSEYWNQVNNLVGGTAQPQFNANALKEINVPIPSLENQKKAVEQLAKIKANYQNISQTIDNLGSALSLSLSLSVMRLKRLAIFA